MDILLSFHFLYKFLLDLNKYYIFKSFDVIKIPKILESEINYTLEAENFKDKIKKSRKWRGWYIFTTHSVYLKYPLMSGAITF